MPKVTRQAIYTSSDDVAQFHLDGIEWNFHDAVTSEFLHGLHPYPAKFIPQIARKAILEFSQPGDTIYDPFCGCGTTLLEASLLGRQSIGTDNNDVAIAVSRAKTATYRKADLEQLKDFANTFSHDLAKTKASDSAIPQEERIAFWFTPAVIDALARIKTLCLRADEPAMSLLLACFSSILVKVSKQDSDTRYARVDRTVTPRQVEASFLRKLREVISVLPSVMVKGRSKVRVVKADARHVAFIKKHSVDLIVTSPPYLNAYDYHKYHRQRLHWLDGDVAYARDNEIGKHDDFTRRGAVPDQYFRDMDACFAEWARVLRTGASCVVLIGDAIVSKEPVPVADMFIELAARHRLMLAKRWIRELKATQRAFNVRNSRMTHEHVLLFTALG